MGKNIFEIKQWLTENHYTMVQGMDEDWRCEHDNGDLTTTTVWEDPACEDAYDEDSATVMAYNHIQDMEVSFIFIWCDADDNEHKRKQYEFHDIKEAKKHALCLLGEDNSNTDHISIYCPFYGITDYRVNNA